VKQHYLLTFKIQTDMDRQEIMAFIADEFVKGAASTIVVNKSADSAMNKGRGANTNPFLGRVMIVKTYCGYVMGTDYQNSLEATAERMGNEGEAHLKKVWHKPTAEHGEWFSTDKATESKVYLKLQRNAKQVGCKTTTTYIVDGHEATAAEEAAITIWLKKKSNTQSSTQVEMGIDKEHEQTFILPQLETIVCIKQGARKVYPQRELAEAEAMAYAVAAV
jgi:hypothetical protein